ncbi:aspartyl glutamyl-tRNA amidotransferase subunit B, putative [Babesia ovis]|uniref:Aspartyl glutamyl-tRNA amidotransferase subunit B, putative n=1 Tax=Babesia ovis TaxID=5869 RepID=A0A9W5TD76_BABOV|nr:aspartyl glutamyl-tRNA amidotransferase subunit B, putative [Babesia ovis]
MKRALHEEAIKRQQAEETIVIPKAKPLQQDEVELVEIHRDITQHWRNVATGQDSFGFVTLGLPTPERVDDPETYDEAEDDALYTKLLEVIDLSAFPEELIQTEYVQPRPMETVDDSADGKQSIRRIEQVMEREANEEETEDHDHQQQDTRHREEDVMDIDLNDDHIGGDYHYSFCDEDDGF